jgi:hypothetical protein
MGSVGNVPNNAWYVMSIRLWHYLASFLNVPFSWQLLQSKSKASAVLSLLSKHFKELTWSDLNPTQPLRQVYKLRALYIKGVVEYTSTSTEKKIYYRVDKKTTS